MNHLWDFGAVILVIPAVFGCHGGDLQWKKTAATIAYFRRTFPTAATYQSFLKKDMSLSQQYKDYIMISNKMSID